MFRVLIFCACFPPGGRAVSAERAPDAGSLTPPSFCQHWPDRVLATRLWRRWRAATPARRRLVDGCPPLEHDVAGRVGGVSK